MAPTYPGFCDVAYPEVFDIRAKPQQPKVLKDGQLKEELVQHFFEKVLYYERTIF